MKLLPRYLDGLPPTIRRALGWSTLDAMFFSLMNGMGNTALVFYAVALGMSNLTVGLAATVPILAGSVAQLLAPALERLCGGRKRAVLVGCLGQVAGWAAIPLVAHLDQGRETALLVITSVQNIGWFITIPSWVSWMGDLVPPLHRGRFFAWKAVPSQACEFLSIVGMGYWMGFHEARPLADQISAFHGIFLAAAAFRLLSVACLALQHEPPVGGGADLGPVEAVPSRWGRSPLFLAMAFYGVFHLFLFVSGPYFGPYMRTLGLDYRHISWILSVSFLSKMLFLPAWGRAAARYGNRSVILVSGTMTALLPLLWMLSGDWRYLVGVMILNGAIWGGIELCEIPYLMELTAPADRTRLSALYYSVRSLCDCAGAVLGDLAMRGLSGEPAALPFLAVLFLSSLGRYAVCLWGRRRLAEGPPAGGRAVPRSRGHRVLTEVLLLR